jgi:hypothetical protein
MYVIVSYIYFLFKETPPKLKIDLLKHIFM